MADSIDSKKLKELLAGGQPLTLLDVRRKTDYEADPRSIGGAPWRNPEEIEDWAAQLPAGRPTVVYCVKGGSVSQSVAERLKEQGLDSVYLEGGLKSWTGMGEACEAIDAGHRQA